MNIFELGKIAKLLRKDATKAFLLLVKNLGEEKVKIALEKSIRRDITPMKRLELAKDFRKVADALETNRPGDAAQILTDLITGIE